MFEVTPDSGVLVWKSQQPFQKYTTNSPPNISDSVSVTVMKFYGNTTSAHCLRYHGQSISGPVGKQEDQTHKSSSINDSWPRHRFIPLDHLEKVCICVCQQESDGETKNRGQRPDLWMYFTLREQIKSLLKARKDNIWHHEISCCNRLCRVHTARFLPLFSLADRFCEIENRCLVMRVNF